MRFSGRPCVFSDQSIKSLQLRIEESVSLSPPSPPPISLGLSISVFLPLLVPWARETAVFSHTLEERRRLNCGIWLSCQSNSELHTCQPLASWDGKMTEAVFLAFSSWQAHYYLHSPSVHRGLHFSLEALGELSSFTTASNKQLPFEKVGFLGEHGLLPPLRLLPFPTPSQEHWHKSSFSLSSRCFASVSIFLLQPPWLPRGNPKAPSANGSFSDQFVK